MSRPVITPNALAAVRAREKDTNEQKMYYLDGEAMKHSIKAAEGAFKNVKNNKKTFNIFDFRLQYPHVTQTSIDSLPNLQFQKNYDEQKSSRQLELIQKRSNDVLFYTDLVNLTGIARENIANEYAKLERVFKQRQNVQNVKNIFVSPSDNVLYDVNTRIKLVTFPHGGQLNFVFQATLPDYGDDSTNRIIFEFLYYLFTIIENVNELQLYVAWIISRYFKLDFKLPIQHYVTPKAFFGHLISAFMESNPFVSNTWDTGSKISFRQAKAALLISAFYTVFNFSSYTFDMLGDNMVDLIFNHPKSFTQNQFKIKILESDSRTQINWSLYWLPSNEMDYTTFREHAQKTSSYIINTAEWIYELHRNELKKLLFLIVDDKATNKIWNRLYIIDRELWHNKIERLFKRDNTKHPYNPRIIESLLKDTTHRYLFTTLTEQFNAFLTYYQDTIREIESQMYNLTDNEQIELQNEAFDDAIDMAPMLGSILSNEVRMCDWILCLIQFIDPLIINRIHDTYQMYDIRVVIFNEVRITTFVNSSANDFAQAVYIEPGSDSTNTFNISDVIKKFRDITFDKDTGFDKETVIEIILLNYSPLHKPNVETFEAKIRRLVYEIYGSTPKQFIASQFRKQGVVRTNESKDDETGSKRGKTENYMDDVVSFVMIPLTEEIEDVSTSTQMSDVE